MRERNSKHSSIRAIARRVIRLVAIIAMGLALLLICPNLRADQIIVDKSRQTLFLIDDDNHIVFESKVIVGRDSRPTPNFTDTITHIVSDPYWNIPVSLLHKDVIPKIKKYKNYMEYQGLEVIDRNGTDVTEIFKAVDYEMQPDRGWRMRQKPGPRNVLGNLKFMLADRMKFGPAIFLHDTNEPELYFEEERRFSSGCIRVERWEELSHILGLAYVPEGHERWHKIEPITITIVGE